MSSDPCYRIKGANKETSDETKVIVGPGFTLAATLLIFFFFVAAGHRVHFKDYLARLKNMQAILLAVAAIAGLGGPDVTDATAVREGGNFM